MCERPIPTLESTDGEQQPAVQTTEPIPMEIPEKSDCTAVIYFNANDVKHDAEKAKLQSYKFRDGHVADGIGLFISVTGLGVAFWRSTPTPKDPHHGVWLKQGFISRNELQDFGKCYEMMHHLCQLQEHCENERKRLAAKGVNGLAAMMDDKFRRKFMQVTQLSMKINSQFRKIWFRKDNRYISRCP